LNAPYTHNRAVVFALGGSGANIDMAMRSDALLPNQYSVAKKNVKLWCGRNYSAIERKRLIQACSQQTVKSRQYLRAMTKIARRGL
jgi:hypothetical protein